MTTTTKQQKNTENILVLTATIVCNKLTTNAKEDQNGDGSTV